MDIEVISSKAQEKRFIYMSGYPVHRLVLHQGEIL